jgi:hypothetical protein
MAPSSVKKTNNTTKTTKIKITKTKKPKQKPKTKTKITKLIEDFEINLKLCSEKIENARTTHCKFGKDCIGTTAKHFSQYSHPSMHHIDDILKFKKCAVEYLLSSRNLYDSNHRKLPKEWYIIIQKYLKESDYTRHDSHYFYIIANIACNFKYFIKRFGRNFMNAVLMGMEEHAVTGMYEVEEYSSVQACLLNLGVRRDTADGKHYVANTTLLGVLPYTF